MPASRRSFRRSLPLAAALVLLVGCASTVPIGDLLSNSSKYNGKSVRIKGQVTRSVGAIVAGAYEVKDNTGQITVVARATAHRPRRHDRGKGHLPGADHAGVEEPGGAEGAEPVESVSRGS